MRPNCAISVFSALLLACCLTSCFNDDDDDFSEWKKQNEAYVAEMEDNSEYIRLTPPWSPASFTLTKWHNDRALTAKNLSPMDNSYCDVIYQLLNIEGDTIASSYKTQTYGDSIYRTRPSGNIIGFWYTLTQMHVGDSVTAIMPAVSAYGAATYGDVKPYSTLIYRIKLVGIPAYEVPLK